MEILTKICKARLALQNAKLKKSGWNDYSQYDYFELSDFLPKINELAVELGFVCIFRLTSENATLSVIDVNDSNDSITFDCPTATAQLRAAHEVQNLGAVMTYLRRYLYMIAFEVVENDILDRTHDKSREDNPKKSTIDKTHDNRQADSRKKSTIDKGRPSALDALRNELNKAKTADDVLSLSDRFASALADGRITISEDETSQAKNLINSRIDFIEMENQK